MFESSNIQNLVPVDGADKLKYNITDSATGLFHANRVMEAIGLRIIEYQLRYNRRRGTDTPLFQTDIIPPVVFGPKHYIYMFGEPENPQDFDYGLPLWDGSTVRRLVTRIGGAAIKANAELAASRAKVKSESHYKDGEKVIEIFKAQRIRGVPDFPLRLLDDGRVRISVNRPQSLPSEQLVGVEFRPIAGRDTRDAHGKGVLLRNP